MTNDFMKDPFPEEESKQGKARNEKVPDTWALKELRQRLNMPHRVAWLLVILQTRSWVEGSCYPSNKQLLDDMQPRCSRSTLYKMIAELKKRKIIKVRRRREKHGFRSSVYSFIQPWTEETLDGEPYYDNYEKGN